MAKFDILSIFKKKEKETSSTDKLDKPKKVKKVEEMTFNELIELSNELSKKQIKMELDNSPQEKIDEVFEEHYKIMKIISAMCADPNNKEASLYVLEIEKTFADSFRTKSNGEKKLKAIREKLKLLEELDAKKSLADLIGTEKLTADEEAKLKILKEVESKLREEEKYLKSIVSSAKIKFEAAKISIESYDISTPKIEEIKEEIKKEEEREFDEIVKEFEEDQKDKKTRDDGDGQTSPTGNEDDGFGPGNF